MSIDFYGLTFVVSCDSCSETLDTDKDREDGFQAAVDVAKRAGWRVSKDRGEWTHTCPCCCENDVQDDFD